MEIIVLFKLRATRVIQIEPSDLKMITARETHEEDLLMEYSSPTPSFSMLSIALEILRLRWYRTGLGDTAASFIELSV